MNGDSVSANYGTQPFSIRRGIFLTVTMRWRWAYWIWMSLRVVGSRRADSVRFDIVGGLVTSG